MYMYVHCVYFIIHSLYEYMFNKYSNQYISLVFFTYIYRSVRTIVCIDLKSKHISAK